MTVLDWLVIFMSFFLLACGFLFWPIMTLRAARQDRRADEDAVFLKRAPDKFQSLITLETLGSLFLILGASALLLGQILALVGWLSENQTVLSAGVILSILAVLSCITSVILQKRAKKQRTALRAALGTKNTAHDLGLGDAIMDDLYERLESNIRIREDELQSYDMFFRK